MSFALHEVQSIARDVARGYRPEIEVIAVTPAEGGESAELIVASGVDAAGLVSIHVVRGGTDAQLRGSIAQGLVRHFGDRRA